MSYFNLRVTSKRWGPCGRTCFQRRHGSIRRRLHSNYRPAVVVVGLIIQHTAKSHSGKFIVIAFTSEVEKERGRGDVCGCQLGISCWHGIFVPCHRPLMGAFLMTEALFGTCTSRIYYFNVLRSTGCKILAIWRDLEKLRIVFVHGCQGVSFSLPFMPLLQVPSTHLASLLFVS